ncbi:uncharacterized protein TNCV_4490361 [Trichonephila clavipes]|nr:uncharacterized protein TNCV_4490361 [Trichonephila clavipes]
MGHLQFSPSFTIMAASLAVVTPRVQTLNNDPMATCTGHFTAGGSIKSRDNRWGGIKVDSHNGAQRNINPELRVGSGFRVNWSHFFLGVENVTEFLENIDNNLTYYEIPTQLACAYLKGHLTGRALDWFDILGYKVVEEKATDYAQLKHAL